MASSESFVQFILDQLANAGGVTARKMFGEYCLYHSGKVVAMVCDDKLFVKPTPEGEAVLGSVTLCPPYPGGKGWFLIENPDDHELLCQLVKATSRVLPEPKPKVKKKK